MEPLSPLASWVLAAALTFAPPAQHPQYPGREESEAQAEERYESIARDIATVAEAEPQTRGGFSPDSKAALLLALAIGESSLALDADIGPCWRGSSRHSPLRARCDGGLAASIWQLHPVMWDGEMLRQKDLFANRERAGTIVLRLAIGSFGMCKKLAPEDRLSGAGLGHCEAGNESVRARFKLFQKLRSWKPPSPTRAEVARRDERRP